MTSHHAGGPSNRDESILSACGDDAARRRFPTPRNSDHHGPASPGVPTEGTRPAADNLPPPAEPGRAPAPVGTPPGRQVAVGDAPEGVVVDATTRTVAVAKRNPNELVLINADTGDVSTRVPLPGFVRHLQLAKPGGPVLVPVESANALVRVDLPGGRAEPQLITGTVPHDASEAPNGTVFVANEHGGTVAAIRGDDIVKVFTDSVQPAGLAPVGTSMGLLDVRKNDLTIYDSRQTHHRRVDSGGGRPDPSGGRQTRKAHRRRHPRRRSARLHHRTA